MTLNDLNRDKNEKKIFQGYSAYYDINNDKVLTVGEAAQALNLEIKDLDDVTSYDELNNNSCAYIKIENTNLKLVADI